VPEAAVAAGGTGVVDHPHSYRVGPSWHTLVYSDKGKISGERPPIYMY